MEIIPKKKTHKWFTPAVGMVEIEQTPHSQLFWN